MSAGESANGKKVGGEGRLSCPPEHVLNLIRLVQRGDVAAEHELQALFAPKLRCALAPYRRDNAVGEELDGEGYVILHDLIMRFDAQRGVNFFTYLDRTLPKTVWSFVRRERTTVRRLTEWGD